MAMPEISVNQYLSELEALLRHANGQQAAEYLSIQHHHAKSSKIISSNADVSVKKYFRAPWEEVIYYHIKCVQDIDKKDYIKAFKHHFSICQSFMKIFQNQKDGNWALPIMYSFCLDLRNISIKADSQAKKKNNTNEMLEKGADIFMGFFRICVGDTRSSLKDSKRWGILYLTNQLFKIYFKVNKLHLLKPLIRVIESSNLKDQYPISQRVTYKYFLGQQQVFESKFKEAEENLTFAFQHCHKDFKKNKRLILIFLITAKMVLGILPSMDLLQKYNLMQFAELVNAVRAGNLHQFDKAMEASDRFFIKWGISLVLEKLRIIVHRNLFKKVYLMHQTHIIDVRAFTHALYFGKEEEEDEEEDDDEKDQETLCFLSNLIHDNKMRGYISHEHMKVVLSKQNAFPALPAIE